ncbi:MAG: hypothetical protein KJO08_01650 [Gammaproteobacteria bacterium]|nr:hypothetical protein [Gammaproteobacteria bacterium]
MKIVSLVPTRPAWELDLGAPAPYLVPEQTTENPPNETQPLQKFTAGLSH